MVSGNGDGSGFAGIEKEFDISDRDPSLPIIFSHEWRARSRSNSNTRTNSRFRIIDAETNTIFHSESLNNVQTRDTGLQTNVFDMSNILDGVNRIKIQLYMNEVGNNSDLEQSNHHDNPKITYTKLP